MISAWGLGSGGFFPLLATSRTVTGIPRAPASRPARRDAKRPFAPPSTASRMRSRFGMNALRSYSSRSMRAFSSRRIGSRRSAQRKVGGIAVLAIDLFGENGRLADQNAGDERAEHRVHADQLRD